MKIMNNIKNKRKIIIISSCVVAFFVIVGVIFSNINNKYTYEWVKVDNSSVGQYLLYINNYRGKHVDGTARLVYINGKTKRVNIDKDGLLYVKNIVAEVRNPDKRW